MRREEIYREIQEHLGIVPSYFRTLPDAALPGEWRLAREYYQELSAACPGPLCLSGDDQLLLSRLL